MAYYSAGIHSVERHRPPEKAKVRMADPEAAAVDPAPVLDGVEDEEEGDEVFLDTTMFDEDDEWLEGALAAPEDEDDDPYYFVQARTTGKHVMSGLLIRHL